MAGNMFTVPDDFVKVVRCQDCKFYGIDEDGWCFCDCWGGLHQPDARDYCSLGERRSNDGQKP